MHEQPDEVKSLLTNTPSLCCQNMPPGPVYMKQLHRIEPPLQCGEAVNGLAFPRLVVRAFAFSCCRDTP
jgi:hypothetical protein